MVPLWFQKWFYMVAASVQGKGEQRSENWLSYNVVISLEQGLDKQGTHLKIAHEKVFEQVTELEKGEILSQDGRNQ